MQEQSEQESIEMEVIERDHENLAKTMNYVGIIAPVTNQVLKNKKIREMMDNCLAMDPDQLDSLSLHEMDKLLLVLPKALIWLQECENLATIAYEDAKDAYEDTVGTKASLLGKEHFSSSQVSEKMRVAKIKEMYPREYEKRIKELRTKKASMIRLSGQTKHVERLNDNIKKIREALVLRIKKEQKIEGNASDE